jgi:hypothetical protein
MRRTELYIATSAQRTLGAASGPRATHRPDARAVTPDFMAFVLDAALRQALTASEDLTPGRRRSP